MSSMLKRLRPQVLRVLKWLQRSLPVLLDIAGFVLIVAGVWRLERSEPGIYLIVAGAACIAVALRFQRVE